jgi:hypothetical protein
MGMYQLILFCLILIKSPFGSASEDFTKFETILLVGGESLTSLISLTSLANE